MPQTNAGSTAVLTATDVTTPDVASAYAAIKNLEAQNLIPFPESSQTVHVGTFDGATGKFTYAVQTGTESYVTEPVGGGGGGGGKPPLQPEVVGQIAIGHQITVGYVLVYAMDLQLSFSVVNAGPSFTVTMNGKSATITSGNLLTIDLQSYSTPPQSQFQIPGTLVELVSGARQIDIQLRILRPPCCTAGCFTMPALPTAIVYAPPPGPEKKNFAVYSNATTISNKISTTVSNGSSTKAAKAYSTTDFIDKISGFAGDVVNFAASIASFAGGAPSGGGASGGLLGFLTGGSGTPSSSGNAQNDLKLLEFRSQVIPGHRRWPQYLGHLKHHEPGHRDQ
ncbi:MAG TPA: hypothetical protein VKU19_20480 [Bryobacteraceae bacterium]|nr:hypothetical protein [Bryobacteraceae bacterium]